MNPDEHAMLQALLSSVAANVQSVHRVLQAYDHRVSECIQQINSQVEAIRQERQAEAAERRAERLEEAYQRKQATERRRAWQAVGAAVWVAVGALLAFVSKVAGLWSWMGSP